MWEEVTRDQRRPHTAVWGMEKEKTVYYHVWFVTKYRRSVLEGKKDEMVRSILAECISRNGYNVLESETNKDHVHMLVKVEDKKELVGVVRTLKAVSAKVILQAEACRGKRAFWARRYGCKEVLPEHVAAVRKYIREQTL